MTPSEHAAKAWKEIVEGKPLVDPRAVIERTIYEVLRQYTEEVWKKRMKGKVNK